MDLTHTEQRDRSPGRWRVSDYMTPDPSTLPSGSSLAAAHELLRAGDFRHIPILDGNGKPVGVLSDRETFLAKRERGIAPEDVTVDELMAREPYQVAPDAPIEEAAEALAEHRYGSALVVEAEHVVGILTTTDLLRALVDARRSEGSPR